MQRQSRPRSAKKSMTTPTPIKKEIKEEIQDEGYGVPALHPKSPTPGHESDIEEMPVLVREDMVPMEPLSTRARRSATASAQRPIEVLRGQMMELQSKPLEDAKKGKESCRDFEKTIPDSMDLSKRTDLKVRFTQSGQGDLEFKVEKTDGTRLEDSEKIPYGALFGRRNLKVLYPQMAAEETDDSEEEQEKGVTASSNAERKTMPVLTAAPDQQEGFEHRRESKRIQLENLKKKEIETRKQKEEKAMKEDAEKRKQRIQLQQKEEEMAAKKAVKENERKFQEKNKDCVAFVSGIINEVQNKIDEEKRQRSVDGRFVKAPKRSQSSIPERTPVPVDAPKSSSSSNASTVQATQAKTRSTRSTVQEAFVPNPPSSTPTTSEAARRSTRSNVEETKQGQPPAKKIKTEEGELKKKRLSEIDRLREMDFGPKEGGTLGELNISSKRIRAASRLPTYDVEDDVAGEESDFEAKPEVQEEKVTRAPNEVSPQLAQSTPVPPVQKAIAPSTQAQTAPSSSARNLQNYTLPTASVQPTTSQQPIAPAPSTRQQGQPGSLNPARTRRVAPKLDTQSLGYYVRNSGKMAELLEIQQRGRTEDDEIRLLQEQRRAKEIEYRNLQQAHRHAQGNNFNAPMSAQAQMVNAPMDPAPVRHAQPHVPASSQNPRDHSSIDAPANIRQKPVDAYPAMVHASQVYVTIAPKPPASTHQTPIINTTTVTPPVPIVQAEATPSPLPQRSIATGLSAKEAAAQSRWPPAYILSHALVRTDMFQVSKHIECIRKPAEPQYFEMNGNKFLHCDPKVPPNCNLRYDKWSTDQMRQWVRLVLGPQCEHEAQLLYDKEVDGPLLDLFNKKDDGDIILEGLTVYSKLKLRKASTVILNSLITAYYDHTMTLWNAKQKLLNE